MVGLGITTVIGTFGHDFGDNGDVAGLGNGLPWTIRNSYSRMGRMNMTRTLTARVVIGAAAAALVIGAGAAGASAANTAYADPPSTEVLTQTTNAMLQPADVPAALGGGQDLSTGYNIPPGGQDPMPLCYGKGNMRLIPSLTNAIGYSNKSGQVTEEVYVYPSIAAAQDAWNQLDSAIASKCSFTASSGSTKITSSQGSWSNADQAGRWVNVNNTQKDNPSMYSVVGPVDNAIVITRFQGKNGLKATTADQRSAVDALAGVLIPRYADRESLASVQPALVTNAQNAMLRPGDAPAELPLLQPSAGAWSNFDAQLPSDKPFNTCDPNTPLVPSGTGEFNVGFGGGGDVFMQTGMLYQRAFTYASAEAAEAAWTVLAKNVKRCTNSYGTLFSDGGNYRTTNGSTTIAGAPALWVRSIDSQKWDKDGFVNKSYMVYTMNGDVIVGVQYGKSKYGMKNFPIDEAAVRSLAATAAAQWNATE